MKHTVALRGCRRTPLGSYLKALAVLRLIGSQRDPAVRGWWADGSFWIEGRLSDADIVGFFCDEYAPTPIVGPWNGGSGFYDGDSTVGLDAITESDDGRFAAYRETIAAVRAMPEMPQQDQPLRRIIEMAHGVKKNKKQEEELEDLERRLAALSGIGNLAVKTVEEIEQAGARFGKNSAEGKQLAEVVKRARKFRTLTKKSGGGTKEEIVLACRNRLCDSAAEWLDAAIILRSAADLSYPPILGTAGNEGRLDYTNNFMTRVSALLLTSTAANKSLLRNALFGEASDALESAAVGQFDPGRAGGFNQGQGIEEDKAPNNPWDFVLCLEGAVLWASGVGRRQSPGSSRVAASPFTVLARPVGYGSASEADEARAEIWTPLWSRPSSLGEVRFLLREGRSEIGKRSARDGLEFAEAVASLGVDRGVTNFMRYGLLKRRGDSYVALPIGELAVPDRPLESVELLQDLELFLDGRNDAIGSSNRVDTLRNGLQRAVYDFVKHRSQRHFQGVLRAVGRLEQHLGFEHGPIELRPEWLQAADDGTAEFRIAAALGSISGMQRNLKASDKVYAWRGNSLSRRLASVLQRRMLDEERHGEEWNPQRSVIRIGSSDACAFVAGAVDETVIEELLFGMALIRWRDAERVAAELRDKWGEGDHRVSRTWLLLKHLFFQWSNEDRDDVKIRPEPSIVPLLCANHVKQACDVARRRLMVTGRRPLKGTYGEGEEGVRLAAALLIPVWDIPKLSSRVIEKQEEQVDSEEVVNNV